jgi:cytochrome c5
MIGGSNAPLGGSGLHLAGRKVLCAGITLLCLYHSAAFSNNGQILFEDYCAACHGDDGAALLPGTPSFARGERLEKSDEELLKSIAKGLKVMPPWEGILTDEEMEECLEHARLLTSSRE